MSADVSCFSTYMACASRAWNYQPSGSCPSQAIQHLARIVGIAAGGIWDIIALPYRYFFSSSSLSQRVSSPGGVDPAVKERVDDAAKKSGILPNPSEGAPLNLDPPSSSSSSSSSSSQVDETDPSTSSLFTRIAGVEKQVMGLIQGHQGQIGKLEQAVSQHLPAQLSGEVARIDSLSSGLRNHAAEVQSFRAKIGEFESTFAELKSSIEKAKELEGRVIALESQAAQFEAEAKQEIAGLKSSAEKKEAELSQKFDAMNSEIKGATASLKVDLETKIKESEGYLHKLFHKSSEPAVRVITPPPSAESGSGSSSTAEVPKKTEKKREKHASSAQLTVKKSKSSVEAGQPADSSATSDPTATQEGESKKDHGLHLPNLFGDKKKEKKSTTKSTETVPTVDPLVE